MLAAFLFCFFGTSAALPIGYHTSARPDLSANASQSSGSLSFPDTIWLGGIVPYKIDKQFEEFVREALFGNKSIKELMSKTEDDLDAELKMILRKGGFSDGDYRRSPIHRTQPYGKSTLRGNRFDDSEIPVRPIEYRKQVMHHGIHSPVHSNQYDESMRRFDGTSTDSNSISEGLKSSFDLDVAPSLNTIIGQNSFSIDGLDRNDSINDRLSLLEKQAENFVSTNKLSTENKLSDDDYDELAKALDTELYEILWHIIDGDRETTTVATETESTFADDITNEGSVCCLRNS